MKQEFINQLYTIVGSDNLYIDEPLKKHTTFHIGGPADYYVVPHEISEIKKIITLCKENGISWYILGNGSNLLVSDAGYRGLIIQLFKNYSMIEVKEERLTVQTGALLSKIARKALENELTGLEFAAGIPGTLGGAAVMNAGAYGGEMKTVLEEVTVMDSEGEVFVLPADELEMGYRTSIIAKKGYVVLQAVIKLEKGNKEEIQKRMDELKEARTTKQPLDLPSAGSTFKRPEGYFAGKLIMDAGLRGFTVGGAQVSEKHCGFVVNKGEATAADVISLMRQVSKLVEEQFGVPLEPEVKMLGEFECDL